MSKKRLAIITILVFVVLISIRMIWVAMDKPPAHPHVIQGVLDLRDWDFTKNPIVTLDGQWELYPDQLLMHNAGDPSSASRDMEFIQVPSDWNMSHNGDNGAT